MKTPGQRVKFSERLRDVLPLICLLLGCTFAVALYVWSARGEQQRGAIEFTHHAERFSTELAARTQTYLDLLPGLKALTVLEQDTDDARFAQYISAVSLPRRYPGLALLFTADRVRDESLQHYVDAVRSDHSISPVGRPDFKVIPPGPRPEYMVIRHVAPDATGTVGYDLYDPSRTYRTDVDLAADTGKAVATAPLALARDRDKRHRPERISIVVRMPVYRTIDTPPTTQERRDALRGVVGVAFQTEKLIRSVLTPEMQKRLWIRVFDSGVSGDDGVVYDDTWVEGEHAATSPHGHPLTVTMPLASRAWTIVMQDRVAGWHYWVRPIPLLLLFFGLFASFLLMFLVRTLVSNTRLAEATARDALVQVQQERRALEEAQSIALLGSWEWDIPNNHLYWSVEMCRIYRMTASDFIRDSEQLYERIPEEDRSFVRGCLIAASTDRVPFDIEHRLLTADGGILHVHARANLQHDAAGEPRAMVGTVQDITARKQAEEAARAMQMQYRLLFENSMDGVMLTQPDGSILAANPAACKLFGLPQHELIRLQRDHVVDEDDPRLLALLDVRDSQGRVAGELRMRRSDGTVFEAEVTSSGFTDQNGRTLMSTVIRDVTERRRSEREVMRLAFNDGLTGLPNRRLLMDRLLLALAEARRAGQLGAALFIDLDNFKNINDAKGHAAGDALLCEVAERLKALLRESDTVARLGGDEFVILLSNLADTFEAAARAAMLLSERVKDALCMPFRVDGSQYMLGASIGVSIFPRANQNPSDVLREADTAMYRAKAAGRNRVAFFAQSMQTEVEEQLALEAALEAAVREEQFTLVAQPQFGRDGTECGAELLLRWETAPNGPISPVRFIPLAEQNGLIHRLGDWVIQHACATIATLNARGVRRMLSVNVSPRQFLQADFVERVGKILAAHHTPSGQLIFEVTENSLIANLDEVAERMRELNKMGVRFSIDDFGTGYSSLAYLKRLPLYELKIDKAFIRDTPSDASDTAIVQLIIGMARHLGLRVVAEGVETQEQYAFLHENACDAMQGFLLARPMPLTTWIGSQQHAGGAGQDSGETLSENV